MGSNVLGQKGQSSAINMTITSRREGAVPVQLTVGARGAAAALASSTQGWMQLWHPNLCNCLALHPHGHWESATTFLLLLLLIINKFFVGAFLSELSKMHTPPYSLGLYPWPAEVLLPEGWGSNRHGEAWGGCSGLPLSPKLCSPHSMPEGALF